MRARVGLRVAVVAVAAVPLVGRALEGQEPQALTARGIAAYQTVDYDGAATLLRRALDVEGPNALSDSARAVAYVYLAASEYFRGRRREADAAVNRALAADPQFRPDTLVFPPAVTSAFEAVQRRSRYVRVRVAGDTILRAGDAGLLIRLYVSAPHDVTVALVPEDGPGRVLYEGPVDETRDILWQLPDPQAGALDDGYTLTVTSELPDGRARRIRLPIGTEALGADTLPHPARPADSLFQRERVPRGGVLALSLGLLTGAAAATLPAIVADEGTGSPARFAVGGALSVAGIVALITGPRHDPVAARSNDALREAWRRQVDAVRAENDRRLRRSAWHVTAGRATTTMGPR